MPGRIQVKFVNPMLGDLHGIFAEQAEDSETGGQNSNTFDRFKDCDSPQSGPKGVGINGFRRRTVLTLLPACESGLLDASIFSRMCENSCFRSSIVSSSEFSR